MSVVKTADGRYFDVPEEVLSKYEISAVDVPKYIKNPDAWSNVNEEADVQGQGNGDGPRGGNTAPFGVRG